MKIVKDSKGPCYIISHKRNGITECMFVTRDELAELYKTARDILFS